MFYNYILGQSKEYDDTFINVYLLYPMIGKSNYCNTD